MSSKARNLPGLPRAKSAPESSRRNNKSHKCKSGDENDRVMTSEHVLAHHPPAAASPSMKSWIKHASSMVQRPITRHESASYVTR